MSGTRKGITQARARASQILAEIDTLVTELDRLKNSDLDGAKAGAVDLLDAAVGNAREMIGDVLKTMPRKVPDANGLGYDCTWQIAANPPISLAELNAALRARGVGRAS